MGLRHVVLLKWAEGATPEAVQAIKKALDALKTTIPEIQAYTCGPDARISEGTHDFGIVADFVDEAAYKVYATHADHIKVITDLIKPIVAHRTAVQIYT